VVIGRGSRGWEELGDIGVQDVVAVGIESPQVQGEGRDAEFFADPVHVGHMQCESDWFSGAIKRAQETGWDYSGQGEFREY
jgi:hypothetical protein